MYSMLRGMLTKKVTISLLLLTAGYLLLIVFTHRSLYFSRFDHAYWQDRFDHSQWRMSLSSRTIGDDGLYAIEGYNLIKGADPTLLNAEVPPLGKYLIGLSIQLFGNGYIYSLITGLVAVLLLYLVTKSLTGNTIIALLTSLLLLFDPLFTNQLSITMLDSLQLVFLLLFFLLLTLLFKSKSFRHDMLIILCSGVTVGLFAETKIGLYLPVLFIIAGLLLLKKSQKLALGTVFLAGFGAGYLLPYVPYFIQGHSFTQWLSVQKWIVNFYRGNLLSPQPGDVLTTLLFNRHRNLYSGIWETSHEWSPVWPLVTILGSVGLWKMLRQSHSPLWKSFFVYLVAMLVILNSVPFWSRYILLLLPFFYIGTVALVRQIKSKLAIGTTVVLIAINGIYSLPLLFPTPKDMLTQFVYSWEQGFFQDVYEFVSSETKQQISREQFHLTNLNAFYDSQIESVTINASLNHLSRISPQQIPLTISYCTRNLGCFDHQTTISVVKESGQWIVDWQSTYLFPEFTTETKLLTELDLAQRGSIVDSNGQLLATDQPSWIISVNAQQIDPAKRSQLFKDLEKIFDHSVSGLGMELRVYHNSLLSKPIALGVPFKTLSAQEIQSLTAYSGVTVTQWPNRQLVTPTELDVGTTANVLYKEFGTRLYSTTSYQGVSGLEKEYNDTLKGQNGGTLSVVDESGKVVTTLIEVEKVNGRDMRLE